MTTREFIKETLITFYDKLKNVFLKKSEQVIVEGSGANSARMKKGTATGDESFAEGFYTIASEEYSHASGKFNAPGFASTGTSIGDTTYITSTTGTQYTDPIIFSIGCGTGYETYDPSGIDDHRTNAFFVTLSGHVWVLYSRRLSSYDDAGPDPDTYKRIA